MASFPALERDGLDHLYPHAASLPSLRHDYQLDEGDVSSYPLFYRGKLVKQMFSYDEMRFAALWTSGSFLCLPILRVVLLPSSTRKLQSLPNHSHWNWVTSPLFHTAGNDCSGSLLCPIHRTEWWDLLGQLKFSFLPRSRNTAGNVFNCPMKGILCPNLSPENLRTEVIALLISDPRMKKWFAKNPMNRPSNWCDFSFSFYCPFNLLYKNWYLWYYSTKYSVSLFISVLWRRKAFKITSWLLELVIIMMNWEGRGRLCLMLKVRDHFQKSPSMWTLWPSQQRALLVLCTVFCGDRISHEECSFPSFPRQFARILLSSGSGLLSLTMNSQAPLV